MSRRIVVAALVLILFVVYGGLQAVEKGIGEMVNWGQPSRALAWERGSGGECTIIFAGKGVVINFPAMYYQLIEKWDRLIFILRQFFSGLVLTKATGGGIF
ncbi:MAG: hypothetical protein GX973_01955 [Firmicutes bacterium]|nr:hypothetical protein [Bacillota bacterium]